MLMESRGHDWVLDPLIDELHHSVFVVFDHLVDLLEIGLSKLSVLL